MAKASDLEVNFRYILVKIGLIIVIVRISLQLLYFVDIAMDIEPVTRC